MRSIVLSVLSLGALLVFTPSMQAQEKGKGKVSQADQMVNAFLKQLQKAELTDEQTTKVKELMGKTTKDVVKKRTDAGITQEMLKNRTDAQKAAREAGKKQKEVQEAVAAAVSLTEDQKKVMEETDGMMSKARVEVGKLLKAEQIAKLPQQLQSSLKEKAANRRNK